LSQPRHRRAGDPGEAESMMMRGMEFFSSAAPQPMMAVGGSLIGHLIYGSILGAVGGQGAADTQAEDWECRAARAPS